MSRGLAAGDDLERFFDLSPELLCIAGFDGRFRRVNGSWSRVLGIADDVLVASPFVSFVHPDDVERTLAETRRLLADPTPIPFTNRYRTADGSYRRLEWIATSDPAQELFYAVARDVTEILRTETDLAEALAEVDRASRAKSAFLSRMSHELRTPLNAILGFGQVLELSPLRADDVDSVGQILKAGNHLLELINEILDISRIEAGRLALSIEPISVDEVIRDSLELVAPLAAERSIRLEAKPADRFVFADYQRLKQILLNLLSNAIKYNRDGGSVSLSISPDSNQGESVRISVSDTGLGIAPEDVERAFEPFDRLDAASEIEGTGLGLPLSRGLVAAMNGTIGASSIQGEGSTFWIELPAAVSPVKEDGHATTDQQVRAGAAVDGDRTVLYVEDNLSNLKLIERVLASRPEIRLISAMQGQLGLDLAREHQPDLILLDLHLPDMNGDELLHRLRADTQTAATPVVVISADATPGQLERLLRAGARAYLTKPLDVRRFISLTDELLGLVP